MGLNFNFEELEFALAGLNKNTSTEMLDKALDSGSDPVLKSMNKEVPIDTEALKKSLGEIKKEGSGANRKVYLGSTSTDREIVERAYYQEYGNSSMTGKKWMKRSYQNSKEDAINAIADSIVENILK